MRLGFVFVTLLSAILFYWFMDASAMVSQNVVIEKKALPMDVDFEKSQAEVALNTIREEMQMNRLSPNTQLASAAQAHADYLVLNKESSHDEVEGHINFTGVRPIDRALFAGYQTREVSENLSTQNLSAQKSIDGLFSAIYHRFGFLNPSIDELGVGVSQESQNPRNSAFVYLMGNGELNRLCSYPSFKGVGKYFYGVCKEKSHRIAEKKFTRAKNLNKMNNPKVIVYPYDGQDEVPPAFYSEIPDPLPDYEVSGFPVSIMFNDYYFKEIHLEAFELYCEGRVVNNVRLMTKESDPHSRFTDKQFALFPLERLEYDSEYSAVVTYTYQGKVEEKQWKFRTKRPKDTLHTVREKEAYITIEAGRSHTVYFKPVNGHDLVKDLQFPRSVDIEFIDNNTFKMTLNDKNIGDFVIKSDTRTLHISIDSH